MRFTSLEFLYLSTGSATLLRLSCLFNAGLVYSMTCGLLLMVAQTHADERRESDSPFKIEDFAPKRGRYTLSAGIGYTVSDSKSVSVSTISIPIAHGYSILLPDVTLDNRRRDSLFSRVGGRYALNDGFNMSFGFKTNVSRSLIRENSTTRTENESGWQNLTAGVDYRLTSAFDHPFVIAFGEVAVAERSDNSTSYGRSAALGISSHWAFDPVILSLTGTYSYLGRRSSQEKTHDPGDLLTVAASFGIALNPEITARFGFSQNFQGKGKVDGVSGEWSSATSLSVGFSQRLNPKLVMNVDGQAGVAGHDNAQIVVNFSWRP